LFLLVLVPYKHASNRRKVQENNNFDLHFFYNYRFERKVNKRIEEVISWTPVFEKCETRVLSLTMFITEWLETFGYNMTSTKQTKINK